MQLENHQLKEQKLKKILILEEKEENNIYNKHKNLVNPTLDIYFNNQNIPFICILDQGKQILMISLLF